MKETALSHKIDIAKILAERHAAPDFAEELLQATEEFTDLSQSDRVLTLLDGITGILHFLHIAADRSGPEGTQIVNAIGQMDKAKFILFAVASDVLNRCVVKSRLDSEAR